MIAGNHELTFDSSKNKKHEEMKQLLTNCIYLEDSEVTLYGLKIWGSPWQPVFGGWAFNINRGKVRTIVIIIASFSNYNLKLLYISGYFGKMEQNSIRH